MRICIVRGLRSLRGSSLFRAIHRALCAGRCRDGFRLVHYSVQTNHLHLIAEARDARALTRGLQGLAIRLARAVNRRLRRRGRVFRERYRARLVSTPRDARNTLRYVLNNARRHVPHLGRTRTNWLDPCSSAAWFRGWSVPPGTRRCRHLPRDELLRSLGYAGLPPRTALLRSTWSRTGPIEITFVPGPD